MDLEATLTALRPDNPEVTDGTLRIVADACRTYLEAQAMLDAEGSTIPHPKTGQPQPHPALRIRAGAVRTASLDATKQTHTL